MFGFYLLDNCSDSAFSSALWVGCIWGAWYCRRRRQSRPIAQYFFKSIQGWWDFLTKLVISFWSCIARWDCDFFLSNSWSVQSIEWDFTNTDYIDGDKVTVDLFELIAFGLRGCLGSLSWFVLLKSLTDCIVNTIDAQRRIQIVLNSDRFLAFQFGSISLLVPGLNFRSPIIATLSSNAWTMNRFFMPLLWAVKISAAMLLDSAYFQWDCFIMIFLDLIWIVISPAFLVISLAINKIIFIFDNHLCLAFFIPRAQLTVSSLLCKQIWRCGAD